MILLDRQYVYSPDLYYNFVADIRDRANPKTQNPSGESSNPRRRPKPREILNDLGYRPDRTLPQGGRRSMAARRVIATLVG